MAVALAGQLKEGTKKSHTMAENTGFVACFLKGVVEKKSYRKLINGSCSCRTIERRDKEIPYYG